MWMLLWPLAKANWKLIAVGLAALAIFGWHKLQVSSAYREGVRSEQARAKIEAGKRIAEMEKNDETFRKLPALDRCRVFMRDSGLPEHHCQ
jgi:hypothetical protein